MAAYKHTNSICNTAAYLHFSAIAVDDSVWIYVACRQGEAVISEVIFIFGCLILLRFLLQDQIISKYTHKYFFSKR